MKTILFFSFWALCGALAAQTEKGAVPLVQSTNHQSTDHQTRAVVVGISDYQEKDIPDLRFADRDAEAFANYLRSPGGGSLSTENLRILTNQQATAGQVIAALTWLLEESKPGDQAIIYFSGHGDVEAKLLNQLGFLLLWDSPAHAYLAGALPVDMLRQVVSTLSIEMKTRVFVVVDACRAGKLAGNTVIGTQLTSSQLARQFSQEQKILSCQPNEFSIEGEQWGGGRGVFSWHLCNGLYGLADGDHDGQVSLFEIGRYLEDRVPKEVAPLSQLPLTVGDKSGALFLVDGPTLAALEKQGVPPASIARVEQRGMLQEVLAKADTSARFWYAGFERTLRAGHFFEPAEDCAEFYFRKLSETESVAALHPALRRNYAAALQDDAQQAINIWLKADVQQLECIGKTLKLHPIPPQLQRAAELLGEGHYMYRSLQARKLLFEGISMMWHSNPDEALGRQCLSVFRKSLQLEPNSPLPWHRMSMVYVNNLRMPDSAFICAKKAVELAPRWVLPLAELGYELRKQKKLELAKQALEEAEGIDSQHPFVINLWATWYSLLGGKANEEKAAVLFDAYRESGGALYPCWFNDYSIVLMNLGRYVESEAEIHKAIASDSTNAGLWGTLGFLYSQTRRYVEAEQALKKALALDSTSAALWLNLASLYNKTRRYAEAEPVFKKAIALDSTDATSWLNLGFLYSQTRRYAEAEQVYLKAIALDSTSIAPWNNLGSLYVQTRRYAEAEQAFKKTTSLDPTNALLWNNLGDLYFKTRRYAEAEPVFKKAIALDSTYFRAWNNLAHLYNTTRRYAEAEPVFKKAIALDSTDAGHWINLGNLYINTGRYAEAEPVLKKAVALDSTHAYAWGNLGYLYNLISRYAQAEPVLKKAVSLDSTYASAWVNLGSAYFLTRRYAEAEAAIKKAIALDSTNAGPYRLLGMVCFKTNRLDEARRHFLKTIELSPDAQLARLGLAYLLIAEGKHTEAFAYVEQAIGKKATFEQLEKDEDLAPLRALPKWKELMKKHFPDKAKD